MPLRIDIKCRITTLAGFEGVTRIHAHTIDRQALRDRVVGGLLRLREAGRIAGMVIGDECVVGLGPLQDPQDRG
jgi:hypothetical protein